MGTYINIGNEKFQSSRAGEYVDKSGLIGVINHTLFTKKRFSCITRCRRFGKSMAAEMLCAYYDHSCNSRSLFEDLQIAKDPSFEQHLNKYPVIYLDLSDFVTEIKDASIVKQMQQTLKEDIHQSYPDVEMKEDESLMSFLIRINEETRQKFIFIIDEWDAICREFNKQPEVMNEYVDWLRRLFKSGQSEIVFAGVYMTGILPIKKYNTESALNNFKEYSMVDPGNMASFFGFTRDEVRVLARKYDMDFDDLEKWYDGYRIGDEPSIFNPNSVMEALSRHRCRSYWGKTGAYDAVAEYIQMNYEGLKDDIIRMLGGMRCPVDSTGFQNDMAEVSSRDDALTVLIHLGYLSYDWDEEMCFVPNREVANEMANAVKKTNWQPVVDALQQSKQLLESTLACDEQAVAAALESAHDENTSVLSYNNENSLACVISLAYFSARNDYKITREMPSGKGFADMIFIPRKNVDKPALVVELKVNKSAETAISQIKHKNYPASLVDYADNLLLVGINYDKKTKTHTCLIEKG
ncbi:MAG: AAA family ATPase [Bacteroidaceae bacterium]|nr:AAA family ATPase [Bacteroidaceae bacterium]